MKSKNLILFGILVTVLLSSNLSAQTCSNILRSYEYSDGGEVKKTYTVTPEMEYLNITIEKTGGRSEATFNIYVDEQLRHSITFDMVPPEVHASKIEDEIHSLRLEKILGKEVEVRMDLKPAIPSEWRESETHGQLSDWQHNSWFYGSLTFEEEGSSTIVKEDRHRATGRLLNSTTQNSVLIQLRDDCAPAHEIYVRRMSGYGKAQVRVVIHEPGTFGGVTGLIKTFDLPGDESGVLFTVNNQANIAIKIVGKVRTGVKENMKDELLLNYRVTAVAKPSIDIKVLKPVKKSGDGKLH